MKRLNLELVVKVLLLSLVAISGVAIIIDVVSNGSNIL